MNQIKDVHWDNSKNSIFLKSILEYQKNQESTVPFGFTQNQFIDFKNRSRLFLEKKFQKDFSTKLIISSGHQPEFHHPGILFKDILTNSFAEKLDGLALHIIVDSDTSEYEFSFPNKKTNSAFLENIIIQSDVIYAAQKLSVQQKKIILEKLEEQLKIIDCFVSPSNQQDTIQYIQFIKEKIEKDFSFPEISREIREIFFNKYNISMSQINLTELILLDSFKFLVKLIQENITEFQKCYNESLSEYRLLHKIKNHAQPIPNLADGELPFWILDENTNQRLTLKKEDSIEGKLILPKAVTLTMFLRLFLSDFFVHGKGGGRYEEVSEKIFENFFKVQASPYSVASITMNLNPTNCFDQIEIDEKTLEQKFRDTVYSPEKFLEQDNLLVIEKRDLQSKFSDVSIDKKELHQKISKLNIEMISLIQDKITELNDIKKRLPDILKTREVFSTRTFPFYYYDLDELILYSKSNLKF